MSTRTGTPAEYVVCVENADYPVSLELHKIYRALPDEDALAGDLRIVDESGTTCILPEHSSASACRRASARPSDAPHPPEPIPYSFIHENTNDTIKFSWPLRAIDDSCPRISAI